MRKFTGGQKVSRNSDSGQKTSGNSNSGEKVSRNSDSGQKTSGNSISGQKTSGNSNSGQKASKPLEYVNPEVDRILRADLEFFFKPTEQGGKGWTPDTDMPELKQTLMVWQLINGTDKIPSFKTRRENASVATPGNVSTATTGGRRRKTRKSKKSTR